ncbi:MAG: T9SS type A sorting domain-containing protein, partial [Rudanella sp.]|nr:T9SS type A sorting domain-containing protein [Rudanella sp.]
LNPLCIIKTYTLLALLCLMATPAWATHFLGGQIQAKNLSGNTYEITVVLYMDEANGKVAADQTSTIPVCLGDGMTVNAVRAARIIIGQNISVNNYRFTYTYPAPGVYLITMSLENRTSMTNLSQAVESRFALSTSIQTRGNLKNASPIFEPTPDLWQVGTNQRTTLSFRATDAEGDSLTYALVRPLTNSSSTACATPSVVGQYIFPNDVSKKGTYKLNARTGELVWDAPTTAGQYSTAILIREWRAGALISESYVETVIRVQDKAGTPSAIPPHEPAAEVGIITGTDLEADNVLLLTVSPNPVQSQFVARLRSGKATTARLQLLNVSGQIIIEKSLPHPSTDHETTFSTDNLPPGLYVLKAEVGGLVLSQKVIKQ